VHLVEIVAANGSADGYWATWGAAREGARVVLTRAEAVALLLLLTGATLLIAFEPRSGLRLALVTASALYFFSGVYKLWLLIAGDRASGGPAGGLLPPADDEVPVYTVMVPLHREGRVLGRLVERLCALDYPTDRLQVLLLIETDDEETWNAVRGFALPEHIQPVSLPAGQPRTKPRALNIGLCESRGEFVVIYDAEDHPEPDQLRKAVAALRSSSVDVVCVQARLNFYNRHQSVLTRLFALDYAVWYDQLLPGLIRGRGRFVPLGGTSNHFRIDALRRVGGWDPYNVTEDCDLGVRMGRERLRVAMVDSSTWEEAVPRVRPWVRQRSRWVKGYLQTFLVHVRHPLRLWAQLGTRGFVDSAIPSTGPRPSTA
jgi:cellulose synthase/poly-beta-1,6-N-acetylglucosamine synthase-like glycosyltransferase